MNKLSLNIMTLSGGNELNISPVTEETISIFRSFLSIFGEENDNKLNLSPVQQATKEIKAKVASLVTQFANRAPALHALDKKFRDMKNDEFFLILPLLPKETKDKLELELYLLSINNAEDISSVESHFESQRSEIKTYFGELLENYDIFQPRVDNRTYIGESDKTKRQCRFCRKTTQDKATFRKIAHAIPEGLGNKSLIINEECDTCNEFFGDNIEPSLIEFLNIFRVVSGSKGKNGLPKITYKDGTIQSVDGVMVISSQQKIHKQEDGVFTVNLGASNKFVPVNFYKALCKMAISTVGHEQLQYLSKTIDWIRFGEPSKANLPKVAGLIAGFSKLPTITLYIRKSSSSLPHLTGEFKYGPLIYVFIVPFSEKDTLDFSVVENYDLFWHNFRHYNEMKKWAFQDFSETREIFFNNTFRFMQREQ